ELHPRLHRLLVPEPAVDQRPFASIVHEEHIRRLRPRIKRRLRRDRVNVRRYLHKIVILSPRPQHQVCPANTITRIRHLVLVAKNLGGPALSAASDYSLLTVHHLPATHLSAPPSVPCPTAFRTAAASSASHLPARTRTSRNSGCPARCP